MKSQWAVSADIYMLPALQRDGAAFKITRGI